MVCKVVENGLNFGKVYCQRLRELRSLRKFKSKYLYPVKNDVYKFAGLEL